MYPGNDFFPLFERANIALMMGRTSGNALAIDCDSQAAFEAIGRELDTRGLSYWALSSHRGGAYILRMIEGETANQTEGQTPYQDVQVWGNTHYILIPPSIHPSGTVYTWTKRATLQAIKISDLEWLGVSLALEARSKWQEPELYGLPEWGIKLSRPNREIYANGANEGSRNNKLTALAYDLAGCQIDYQEAKSALLEAAERCNPEYPKRDALAILKSAYKEKREPARKGGEYALKDWQKAKALALSFDWRGTFGRRSTTRKAVYLACVERSRMDNGDVFRASIRELSERANAGTATVQDAIHDLIGASLLRYVGTAKQTGANLYAFDVSKDYSKPDTLIPPCSNSVSSLEYPKTDAEMNYPAASGRGIGPLE